MNRLDKLKSKIHMLIRRLPGQQGNTLAYIAMVLVIFGVIGVAMISLLTSAVTSSATPNYSRRAQYASEAGVRYAMSQLRSNNFKSSVVDDLNTTTYVLSTGDKFELNVFSLWLRSTSDESIPTDGTQVTGSIEEGEIPATFSMTPGNIFAVNIESTQDDGAGNLIIPAPASGTKSTAAIQSYSKTGTSMTLTLADDFEINKDNRMCLAVHPLTDQSPLTGGSLNVHADARLIFPKYDGAVYIHNEVVYYEQAIYHSGPPAKLELKNLSGGVNVDTDNYVILWPSNHLITSTGTSETVSQGAYPASSINIFDADDLTTDKKGAAAADLNLKNMNLAGPAPEDKDIREKETDSGFITADDTGKSLDIGSGMATPEFGNVWYDEDKAIGGQTNYCSAGACLFGPGLRVFFTLKYSGDGDGLTFALISAGGTSINTADSVGGDIELSELIGFGGNSLIDTNGPVYLDGNGDGLQPPKIALEFDTRTNNANTDYCQDANTVNPDTRNDPLINDKDALQYVFWGRTTSLNIPCRNNDPTYDDNRHDAEVAEGELVWSFQTNEGEAIIDPIAYGRPVFGSDGTIHVASNGQNSGVSKIHAINPDGTLKWVYGLGDETKYSPGINPTVAGVTDPYDDDVYSDIAGNELVAIDSEGNFRWLTTGVDRDIDCQPLVTADGSIYFGDDDWDLYSYDDTGSQNWTYDTNVAGEIDVIPALAPDGKIYFVANEDGLIAFQTDPENPTSNPTFLWKRTEVQSIDDIGASGTEDWGELNSSPVIDDNGFIYVGDDDGNVYSFFPNGSPRWVPPYATGDNVDSSPYVDPVRDRIYVGSNDKKVHAIDPFLGLAVPGWPFDTSAQGLGFGGKVRSSPIVDSDGTIYVGSDDYLLYAINPDGTLWWSYQTDGRVKSSPAIGPDDLIYVGDTAGKVYALSRFARPRNKKNLMITSEGTSPNFTVGGEPVELDDPDDWLAGDDLDKGPWAVRMEIKRSLTTNANLKYEYTLHTWIRQCATMIASSECDDPDIIGTFFQDTRLEYNAKPPHLTQIIELDQADQDLFDRFLFGFTGASGDMASQNAIIEKLQLSFIRPGDPVVTTDPNW
jgi:Tfp pilus assembly protein PilX